MAEQGSQDPPELISYGLRVFARSPEGFYVEVVADETERPLEWLAKTTRGLKTQKFEPVNPFPVPQVQVPAAPAPAAPARQAPQGGGNNGGRPSGPPQGGGGRQGQQGGRQGGGGGRGGGGGGGGSANYHGQIYDVCPWDGADVYDNRQKKADGGWRGPFFGCRNGRQCGWAVWRSDGTYDE